MLPDGAKAMPQQCFNPQWIERLRYDPAKAPPSGRMEIEDASHLI
jgi:hypothetical protein